VAKQTKQVGGPLETFTRMMFTRIVTSLARTLRDEALSIGQIAGLHLVDALVRQGLVGRAEDADDRRVRTLTLTAEGRAFVGRIGEDRVRVILETAETLPKQLVEAVMSGVQRYFGKPQG
jgi:DNA-binding MarR family transcriptional regulator